MGERPSVLGLAEKLGFSTAAVHDRIYSLCQKQEKRHARYYDGHFWVRIPPKNYPRVFPYLSSKTVGRSLRKFRNEGLVREVHHGRIRYYTII